jgi:hypothetical protein
VKVLAGTGLELKFGMSGFPAADSAIPSTNLVDQSFLQYEE